MFNRILQFISQPYYRFGESNYKTENDFLNGRNKLSVILNKLSVSNQVTQAILSIPREKFVPEAQKSYAYEDRALRIGYGQTISQPSLVGRMIDYLEPTANHTILDIGTGSGYQAAILSEIVKRVISVERIEELRVSATKLITKILKLENINIYPTRKILGWPDNAPYDGIIVGAATQTIPTILVNQLAIGKRMVVPVGSPSQQNIYVITRSVNGFEIQKKESVRFVPLLID